MGKAARGINRSDFDDFRLLCKFQKLLHEEPYAKRVKLKSIIGCNKNVILKSPFVTVDIGMDKAGERVRNGGFGGLFHCGNSWACPVCAARKLHEKAAEITELIEIQRQLGKAAVMLTFTRPNYDWQSAGDVLSGLTKARRHFFSSSRWRKIYKGLGGAERCSVFSTECTYGENGWHFHNHILIFIDEDAENMRGLVNAMPELRKLWCDAMERADILNSHSHFSQTRGVYLRVGSDGLPVIVKDGNYLTDFGLANEISKETNGSGRSPFDLLASDDPADNQLFLEYAYAVKGYARVKIMAYGLKNQIRETAKKKCTDDTSVETVCCIPSTIWREIVDDEYATGTPHRRNILVAALGGIDNVKVYFTSIGYTEDCVLPPVKWFKSYRERAA